MIDLMLCPCRVHRGTMFPGPMIKEKVMKMTSGTQLARNQPFVPDSVRNSWTLRPMKYVLRS